MSRDGPYDRYDRRDRYDRYDDRRRDDRYDHRDRYDARSREDGDDARGRGRPSDWDRRRRGGRDDDDGRDERAFERGRSSERYDAHDRGRWRDERGERRFGGREDQRLGARGRGSPPPSGERRGDGSRERYGREDDRYRERDRGYAPPSSSAPPPRFGALPRRPDQRSTETREALASRWLEQNANNQRRVSDATMEKLKREIVIGNLVSGQIGATILCELLNDLLKKVVPEACQAVGNLPPVLSIVMDAGQRYAHLQLRSPALATAALGLDQMHVLGRPVHINRPDGYFENQEEPRSILDVAHVLPAPTKVQDVYAALGDKKNSEQAKLDALERAKKIQQALSAAVDARNEREAMAPQKSPTAYLRLRNMVDVKVLLSARERKELRYDIEDECGKCGKVIRVIVLTPSNEDVDAQAPSEAYVRFEDVRDAIKAHAMMDGRKFGGRTVESRYIDAEEFEEIERRKNLQQSS